MGAEMVIVLAKEFVGYILLAGELYPTQHHFSSKNKVMGEVGWEVGAARSPDLRWCHTPLPLFGQQNIYQRPCKQPANFEFLETLPILLFDQLPYSLLQKHLHAVVLKVSWNFIYHHYCQ